MTLASDWTVLGRRGSVKYGKGGQRTKAPVESDSSARRGCSEFYLNAEARIAAIFSDAVPSP